MKKLLIGKIEGSFSSESEVPLFLWSFVSNETLLSPAVLEAIPDLNYSHEKNARINEALNIAIDHVFLPALARELNQRHGVHYSDSFWAILLKSWMGGIVNTAYYYYLVLKKVFSENPELLLVSLSQRKSKIEFTDTFDYIDRGGADWRFHQFIVSEIIRHCFSDKIQEASPVDYSPPKAGLVSKKIGVRDARSQRFLRVPGFSIVTEIMISLILRFKKPIKPASSDPLFLPNSSSNKIDPESIECILSLLRITIPLSFTSHFDRYEKKAKSKRYQKGKLRVVGALTSYYEQIKYYLAHAKEKGELLLTCQHGGNYGWHLSHWEPFLIEYRYDHFISWGWQHKSLVFDSVIPLPSPYLRKLKNKHRFKNNSMLLVGTGINPFYTAFIPHPHEGRKLLAYRHDKIRFLETLSKDNLKKFKYRGYPRTLNQFEDSSYIKKHFPDISFSKGKVGRIKRQLFSTQLCVMDHLGTTLIICLAANVPFICFWRPEFCDLNPSGLSIIQEMKQENLYFDDPEKAADFINSIESIESWWASKQTIRAKIRDLHADTSPCLWKWVTTLWELGGDC